MISVHQIYQINYKFYQDPFGFLFYTYNAVEKKSSEKKKLLYHKIAHNLRKVLVTKLALYNILIH